MERVRLPVDVELEDQLAFGLTARQLVILGAAALLGYGVFSVVLSVLPVPLAAAAATPVALVGVGLALGRRDGLSGDRLAHAALRHFGSPRRQVLAPDGLPDAASGAPPAERTSPLDVPIREVLCSGVIELSDGGYALLATATAAGFALRSSEEQAALVEAYGGFLNSLVEQAAIAVRAEQVDLDAHANALRDNAAQLAHPALRHAAEGHADYLAGLGGEDGIRRRSVLLVLFSRAGDRASARAALERRAGEATDLLRGAGVELRPLAGEEVGSLLPRTLDPGGPPAGTRLSGVVRAC